jgi:hypothetical protein
MSEDRCQKTDVRRQMSEDRGQKTDDGVRKSDPASFRWLQNYAAASDAEVGKRAKSRAHRAEGRSYLKWEAN